MGKKDKKDKHNESEVADADMTIDEGPSYEDKLKYINPIAQPLAPKKLTKKLYKLSKKAQKKKLVRKGVREVQKFVRKGEKGIVIFAGDTSPIDVISHMPIVCEESSLPYVYTPSKEDLGAAYGSKRATCMIMIKPHEDYQELYDDLVDQVKGLPQPIS